MQTSFALLSPPYPGSGRTDAARRGGSRTEPPAAARTSMKAHQARSSGFQRVERRRPRCACPSPARPLERPSVGYGYLSAASHPNRVACPPVTACGQVPTLRSDPGPAAQTPFSATPLFPNGPRDDRSRLRSHTGNSTLPPAPASSRLLRVPCRGSSGRSAASPEPTSQSPAPPREPPPGRAGQRVPATVTRRPLVPSGSQGEDPCHSWGSSRLAGFFGHCAFRTWGLCVEGHRHTLLHPLLSIFNHTQKGTRVYTYGLTCSLSTHIHHPYTT